MQASIPSWRVLAQARRRRPRASSAGSGSEPGRIGSPTWMRTGARQARRGEKPWWRVISRWAPQMETGMIGTPASAAIRTAPVLHSRTVKLRLTPASGRTAMYSPSLSRATAAS